MKIHAGANYYLIKIYVAPGGSNVVTGPIEGDR
jgi:hypothetical protein